MRTLKSQNTKIRLGVLGALAVCGLWALPAAADEAGSLAQIKSAVLYLDKAYAGEDVETIKPMTAPDDVSIAPQSRAGPR